MPRPGSPERDPLNDTPQLDDAPRRRVNVRSDRIASRQRPAKWKRPPLRIEASECINCDACIDACPPRLGAVFRFERTMVILPELCSGCGLCLAPQCPVDCIHEDQEWSPSAPAWWDMPLGPDDYYVPGGRVLTTSKIRRW